MSQQTFDEMKRNFKEKAIGRDPFIRIGHDKGTDPTFGTAKAEGWIQDLVQEGDVLFALADPTNDEVANMVKNKQFRYASPEYVDNYTDKETGSSKGAVLEALALTNEPFLTRLPEARLLADPPDTFYLDHEEVSEGMDKEILEQVKQTNSILGTFTTKLSEWFGKEKKEEPTDPNQKPIETPEQKKLADQMTAMQQQLDAARQAQRAAVVDAKLQGYIQAGIPPAVVDNYRPILLADTGEQVIKLADDKTISLSDQVYATLDAFPENARVKFNQMGESHQPPKAGSPEEIKKLADQDMLELGFEIDEKGRYKLAN